MKRTNKHHMRWVHTMRRMRKKNHHGWVFIFLQQRFLTLLIFAFYQFYILTSLRHACKPCWFRRSVDWFRDARHFCWILIVALTKQQVSNRNSKNVDRHNSQRNNHNKSNKDSDDGGNHNGFQASWTYEFESSDYHFKSNHFNALFDFFFVRICDSEVFYGKEPFFENGKNHRSIFCRTPKSEYLTYKQRMKRSAMEFFFLF